MKRSSVDGGGSSLQGEFPDTLNYGSLGDKGLKSDRDRSRRDEDVKLRSPRALSSDSEDVTRSHSRKGYALDWSRTEEAQPETALSIRSYMARTSFQMERNGPGRVEGARSLWRRNYERDDGDNLDGTEGPRTDRRKYEREGSSRNSAKVFISDKDGLDRREWTTSRKTFMRERHDLDRGEAFNYFARRGLRIQDAGGAGRQSPERTGAKSSYRKGFGFERESAETGMDSIGRRSPLSEFGRSLSCKFSGLERNGRDTHKLWAKKGLGADRDGGGEVTKLPPRNAFGLENDSREIRMSTRKVSAADVDHLERREVYRTSPKERPFPWKGYDFNTDVPDRGPWRRNFSKAPGCGYDGLEEWEGTRSHRGRLHGEEGKRRRSPDNTAPISKREHKEGSQDRSHIVKGGAKIDRGISGGEDAGKWQLQKVVIQEAQFRAESDRNGNVNFEKEPGTEVDVQEQDEDGTSQVWKRMDKNGSTRVLDVEQAEQGNKHETAGESQVCELLFNSSADKIEMEEGEVESEDDFTRNIHKDGIEVAEEERLEERDGCVDAHDKIRVHDPRMQQQDGVFMDNVKGSKPNAVLTGSVEESRRTTEHEADFKTVQRMIIINEREDSGEGSKRSAMDLLGHVQEACNTDSNSQYITAKQDDISRGNVDVLRDLALSLAVNQAVVETKSWEGRYFLEDKESNSVEEPGSSKKLQQIDNMKPTHGEKVRDGEPLELSEVRPQTKKMKLDPLQLSLALPPHTSLSLVPAQVPGYLESENSIQSFGQTCTNSNGFTTSLSFSHTQSFVYDPSCSLITQTSFENQEFSCGSQQISQGGEQMSRSSWETSFGKNVVSCGNSDFTGLPQDRLKHRREISLYQRLLQKGGQSQQVFSAIGGNKTSPFKEREYGRVGNNHASVEGHHIDQTFKTAHKNVLTGLRKGSSLENQSKDRVQKQFMLSPAQSVGSQEKRHEQCRQHEGEGWDFERKQHFTPALKVHSARHGDAGGTTLPSEKIGLLEIVTEPVAVMAMKLQEMPDSFLECLKDLMKEMLENIEKRDDFANLQKILKKRTDLTHDTLLRAHRTQLELLVALNTGMQVFVYPDCHSLTYKALIEIFLQIRCRNVSCQVALPVDDCECRMCSQKDGFCNACMCMICSKFDFDANTCRWVGCDYCMHWCHTDCGLQMSCIAPGPTIGGVVGMSEMQFCCVACDHPSEIFGFVKDVFMACAIDWNAETFAKELDCVKRIFRGSESLGGKQLWWKAEEMLQKLKNKVDDVKDVCRSMLHFFREGNTELEGAHKSAVKIVETEDGCEFGTEAVQARVIKSASDDGGYRLTNLDRSRAALQSCDLQCEEKRTAAADLQYDHARIRAEIVELESIARIKQAEANMFQLRADEARQEADGLQHIMVAKSEKIEEEYGNKFGKLQLKEAEESRRQQFEELQALNRAQQDYQRMKTRMEADMKGLVKQMEATRWQLS